MGRKREVWDRERHFIILMAFHGNVPSMFRTLSWRAGAVPSWSCLLLAQNHQGGALRLGQLCPHSQIAVLSWENGDTRITNHLVAELVPRNLAGLAAHLYYPEFPEEPGQNQHNKSGPE